MSVDRTTIERIRKATFPPSWAWRGYDRVEVERFLDALADYLEKPGGRTRPGGNSHDVDTSERELVVQGDAIETLETQIKELERELHKSVKRERRLAKRLEEASRKPGAPATRPKGSGGQDRPRIPTRRRRPITSSWAQVPRGAVDINEATFDQLRGLGISIAHCARLLALREIRGRIDSLDVLDEIDDMPPETRSALKTRLVVRDRAQSD